MGFGDDLKKQALSWSQKAMERLLSDEKRATQVAQAIGKLQQGKKALEQGQDEVMRAFQFAPKSDYKALGKKLSALKRRVRELDEKVAEALAARP